MMQENNAEWGLRVVFFKNKNLLLIKKPKKRI